MLFSMQFPPCLHTPDHDPACMTIISLAAARRLERSTDWVQLQALVNRKDQGAKGAVRIELCVDVQPELALSGCKVEIPGHAQVLSGNIPLLDS